MSAAEPRRPDAGDEAHDLAEALAALPGDRRAILSLRYLEGFSTAGIAGILGIPEGTVKSRLHNARNELRKRIERAQP